MTGVPIKAAFNHKKIGCFFIDEDKIRMTRPHHLRDDVLLVDFINVWGRGLRCGNRNAVERNRQSRCA